MIQYYLRILQNYANFSGRDTRPQFWWFFLMHFIIIIVLNIIGGLIGFLFLSTLYALGVFLPYLGAAIRRLHDVGKSGWFILIPIYNIILLATEGDKGPNEYGPDPSGQQNFDFDQNPQSGL